MKNLVSKFGVMAGISCTLLFLGPISFYDPNMDSGFMMEYGELIGYGAQFLSMLFVLFGVRAISLKSKDLEFSFLKAFISGLGITVVATFLFYIGNVLFYEIAYPTFLEDFMVAYKPKLLEAAKNAEERAQVEQQFTEWEPLMKNGWLYAGVMCFSVFGFGIFFSLLSAALYKHK